MNEQEPVRSEHVSSELHGEAQPRDGPRIYVASLTDYNAGILHGSWIDAADDPGEMQDGIEIMLAASPTTARYGDTAEEWAIHDYEGFGSLQLSEYEPLSRIAALAAGITEHGRAFTAWAEQVGSDNEALERFSDCYLGEWPSVEAFAESMLDDFGITQDIEKLVPEHIRPYLKLHTEDFARDLELGGDITTAPNPDGGVWIFDGR